MVMIRTFRADADRGGVAPELHAARAKHSGPISHNDRLAKIIAQTILQTGAKGRRCPGPAARSTPCIVVWSNVGMTKTGPLVLALLLLTACGEKTATAPSTPTPTPTPTQTFDETWTAEAGTRRANTTSTSTIRLPDSTYRTYFAGISTALSIDGLSWGNASLVVRSGQGEFNRNPAIYRTGSNTFVMIYEQVVNNVGRFYRATSHDGVNFTVSPSAAVMEPSASDRNFLSVPDIIPLGGGTIRMYFVAGGDLTDSATSNDDGVTWTREGRVTISGLSAANWVVDPDLVRLPSGGYRMYFATGPDGQSGLNSKRIRSATSTDGRMFTLDAGIRVAPLASGDDLVDPDVVELPDGRYRMYYGYSTSGGSYNLMSSVASALAR
jgi:hypothetical protein